MIMPDFTSMTPVLVLVLFALLVPLIHMIGKSNRVDALFALLGLAISGGWVVNYLVGTEVYPVFEGLFQLDAFSALFMLLFMAVASYAVIASYRYVEHDPNGGEYYTLILLATTGMLVVAMSVDLIALFIGIELTSISSFALVGFRKGDAKSSEASMKYFIIGGMSSAIGLFGISLIYGITGFTNFEAISAALGALDGYTPMLMVAMVALIAGFGFKIAMVPFHMWAPDVYEGAPTPVTALLAAGSKKMGIVAMMKLLLIALIAIKADWTLVVAILAIITMTWGNVVAISQKSIKRMLAYSSIAQAGYILIMLPVAAAGMGVVTTDGLSIADWAVASGIFHMITHAFMKGGAFLVVAALAYGGLGERISDYKGLGKRSPVMALSMTIFLLSLAGVPPLAGFASKFFLFSTPIVAALDGAVPDWVAWLAIAGVINSALSLYYYARVIKAIYVDDGESDSRISIPASLVISVVLCVVAVVFMGIFWQPVMDACVAAASAFLG